ncbi:MAG: dCMP deaminase family protein [Eubacterium sp.]|nr:dCMP deaminase family protein [Eubacterium sp.]
MSCLTIRERRSRRGNKVSDKQDTFAKGEKRIDYLSWDQYFMGIATLSAMRSKDPHTSVGACIVGSDNRILSMGYNGMPRGCADDDFPWGREGDDPLNTKYIYVCHAELNAILNYSAGDLKGARIYTTLFPCNECTKALIQVGIAEVIYAANLYPDSASVMAAKKMMKAAGITYRRYESKEREVTLKL